MKRNQPVGTPFRKGGRKGVGRRFTPGHPVVWSDYVTAAALGTAPPLPPNRKRSSSLPQGQHHVPISEA
jgi:hypothetical protein